MHGSYVLVSDIPNRSALDFVFVFAEIIICWKFFQFCWHYAYIFQPLLSLNYAGIIDAGLLLTYIKSLKLH